MSNWTCECIGPQEGQKYCPCMLEQMKKHGEPTK